jgi:UDPglucose 6-dehydrogenase
MRIAVCGMGKVGKPLVEMFRSKGFRAVGYDVRPEATEVSLCEAVRQSDIGLFVVQTPSLEDGSFSNDYLEAALLAFKGEANAQAKSDYTYVVVSTTVPGSCERFREIVGDRICYKPEFIRLEFVREDLLAPSFVLIGSVREDVGNLCQELYSRITDAPVKRMSLTEAELAKITLNCALTMKISLANQLYLVAQKCGADADKIMEAVGSDPRIGNAYLKPGEPYGGPCLPRDNRMFRYFASKVGANAPLSLAADQVNDAISKEKHDLDFVAKP